MRALTAHQIAEAAGGTLVGGDGSVVAHSVSTDSRAVPGGCVFVALRGDKFDGHDYLDEVCQSGATVAVVDRDLPAPAGVALIRVPDTRRALGRLAQVVRRSVTRTRVIAIAGSNGKTSTKNVLHHVLSRRLRGSASPKSFNNDIGVPATLFPVSPDDDYVVLEIGTNHPGEVEHLSRMSEPDVAVITSIGEEHLEFFHTLDNVRRENAAIVAGLRPGGLLVFNGDDERLGPFVADIGNTVRFGTKAGHDLIAADIRVTLDGTRFTVAGADYFTPAIGAHFAVNALAVIAVARHLGLDDESIRAGLAGADASDMRMQRRVCGGVTVLNDAYNANPTSVRAALQALRQVEWPGRRVVVLADMKELGALSVEAHDAIAADVAAVPPDLAFAVGPAWQEPSHAIRGCRWFADSGDAAGVVADTVRDGDLVLLKGSRSMKLERVADAIAAVHR
ncbi:MAG TPA: UDP-N-acetylmuramoyl-tripeptide--D-alanyl-D-alanine ligase [Tepidisphaeraceae bacterium]|jgi:UDP-N-acetylmuramoyl-tripeptide--D-alanyl-D-alanine ligase